MRKRVVCGYVMGIKHDSVYCTLCGKPLVEVTVRYVCSNTACIRHNENFYFEYIKYCDLCASPIIRVDSEEGE